MPRVVTLTTDFGTGSGYVAEMKGRLLHAHTPCTLVDIAHDLPPQDVRAAAWLVGQACLAFPADSLHIVVVDPGVGTSRRLVWARIADQEFLCPDNGVLSRLLSASLASAARVLMVVDAAAATFHGRDVLAPAAVALLDGVTPESLGPPAGPLAILSWPEPRETTAGLVGEVIHVDTFGTLITNLPADLWPRLVAAGRSRLPSNRRFASGRRPEWLRPREVSLSPTSANRLNRRRSLPLAGRPPTGLSSSRCTTTGTSFRRRPTNCLRSTSTRCEPGVTCRLIPECGEGLR